MRSVEALRWPMDIAGPPLTPKNDHVILKTPRARSSFPAWHKFSENGAGRSLPCFRRVKSYAASRCTRCCRHLWRLGRLNRLPGQRPEQPHRPATRGRSVPFCRSGMKSLVRKRPARFQCRRRCRTIERWPGRSRRQSRHQTLRELPERFSLSCLLVDAAAVMAACLGDCAAREQISQRA